MQDGIPHHHLPCKAVESEIIDLILSDFFKAFQTNFLQVGDPIGKRQAITFSHCRCSASTFFPRLQPVRSPFFILRKIPLKRKTDDVPGRPDKISTEQNRERLSPFLVTYQVPECPVLFSVVTTSDYPSNTFCKTFKQVEELSLNKGRTFSELHDDRHIRYS